MRCSKCGDTISENSKFCGVCGAEIENLVIDNTLQQSVDGEFTNPNSNSSSRDGMLTDIDMQQSMPVQENVNTKQPLPPQGNKITRKGNKNLVMLLATIILLLIIALFIFQFMKKSPREIFEKSIDQVFKTVNEAINEDVTTVKGSYELKTTVNAKNSELKQIFDIINKVSIDTNYEIDTEKMIMNMDLNTKYDGKSLLDADMFINKNVGYMYLPGLSEQYFKMDVETAVQSNGINNNVDKEQITIIIEEVQKELKKALKDEYFASMKTTININGKEKKVTKSTLELDNRRANEITKVLLTNLKENETFLTSASKLTEQTAQEIKLSLDESINSISNDTSIDKGKFIVSIFTSGLTHEFIGIQFEIIDTVDNVVIAVQKENQNYYYQVKDGSSEVLNGNMRIDGNIEKNADVIFDLSITNIADMKLEMKYKNETNVVVKEKEITNATDINLLTDVEMQQITQKLLANEGFAKLISDIQNISNLYYNN